MNEKLRYLKHTSNTAACSNSDADKTSNQIGTLSGLYCTILYYAILYHTTLHYTTLYYTILHYIIKITLD